MLVLGAAVLLASCFMTVCCDSGGSYNAQPRCTILPGIAAIAIGLVLFATSPRKSPLA